MPEHLPPGPAAPPAADGLPASPPFARATNICALAVLLLGLAVLAGWALGIEPLKTVAPGLASMKPNTALAFSLAGAALALRQRRAWRLAGGAAVLALGALTLAQDLGHADFGIDQALFDDAAQTLHPGRMSPITAFDFMLIGAALLLLGTRRAALRRAMEALLTLAGMLALLALIGYAYDVAALYRLPGFGSMALHTAVAFALLVAGAFLARTDGLAGVFADAGLGGRVARRLLPLTLLVPLVIGWLALQGEQAGLMNSTQKTAVHVSLTVLVLAAVVWYQAMKLGASDAERQRAADQLREQEAQARLYLANAPAAFAVFDREMRYLGVSRRWLTDYGLPSDVVGRSHYELLPTLPEAWKAVHRRALAGEALSSPGDRVERADGGERWIKWEARPWNGPDGQIGGIVIAAEDISARKHAEQALAVASDKLREREALLGTITERARVGIVMVTAERRYAFANTAFVDVLGLPHGDLIGRRVGELLTSVYESHVRPRLDRAFRGESVAHDLALPPRRPSEGERFFAVTYDPPVPTAHGPCVIVTVLDITERKRRERNFAFLADLQQALTPLSTAADIARVACERLLNHLGLNRCVLGDVDEATGQARVVHDQHAADVPDMTGTYRQADFRSPAERRELAAGKASVTEDIRAEPRPAAELQRFEALGARALVSAPYVADGRWKFTLVVTRGEPYAWPREDVELLTDLAARICVRVERARAEEEVLVGRQRFAGIVESAMDAIVTIDASHHVVLFNAAAERMFRCPASQAIGTSLHRFLPLRFRAAHRDHVERFGRSGTTNRAMGRLGAPLTGLRADGDEFPIEASISMVEAGAERLFSVILRDLTERRKAEALARQRDEELRAAAEVALASKYKSEFLANMSHELRTPLNSLLILSRMLADNRERNLTPRQVEFAEVMHQSGSDLLRLIDDILDLSRIEAGQADVHVEAVGLEALGRKIERQFRPVAFSKPIAFDVTVEPALPAMIRSDSRRLEQVLRNLLANAFKFTARGSVRLDIRRATTGWPQPHAVLDAAGDVVAFAVSDSGIGIARDKQQLIFEAFQQADGSTSRTYGGTGLGLSISREIASMLGGVITLASEPGTGSIFTLYLPHAFEAGATAVTTAPGARHVDHARGADVPVDAIDDDRAAITPGEDVVLLVENDADFARLMLDIAHRHGFKGLVASSASDALQLARQHRPTAITSSVTLPDMDGWQLLQRVGDDVDIRHIPVHIVSGEDECRRGLRQGAASCLQKPMTEDALGALYERIRARKAHAPAKLLLIDDARLTWLQARELVVPSGAIDTTMVSSAEEGLDQLRAQRYDCVVLDLRLPGMTGFEFLEAVRDELAIDDLPIVVYTGLDLSASQHARLEQLAESLLIKDASSPERLLDEVVRHLHCPLETLAPPTRHMIEQLHGAGHALAGSKVLVVDDDMRNVYGLLAILEGAGIEVVHAENGLRCLEVLQAVPGIQAVLMDIMMPGMDGYEATRRIRRMPGCETLPVIALTARAMKGDREKCLDAGVSDYLTKPIDGPGLLARLGSWLRR